MGVWAQIGNTRVTTVPPDGSTVVDVYASFNFGPDDPLTGPVSVPDGTVIKFYIGKGDLSQTGEISLQDVLNSVTPMSGVTFVSKTQPAYSVEGRVETMVVQKADGSWDGMKVAKASINPVGDILKDNITIVATSTYDKIGTANRFSAGQTTLTVSGGQGVFPASVDRYDPAGNIWETKSDMPTGRSGLMCATVNDKIYAIGGYNGNFIGNCEEYDPATDTWIIRGSMTVARGFGCTAVVGTDIYVIGGYNYGPGRASDAVEVYDTVGNAWSTAASLPVPIAFGTCQVVGSDIWVFYGASKFDEKDNFLAKNSVVFRYSGGVWYTVDTQYSGQASTTFTSVSTDGMVVTVPQGAGLPNSGAITIDRAGTPETVAYSSFQAGRLSLLVPLALPHLAGVTVHDAALPRTRMGANIAYDGANTIRIFNGSDNTDINGLVETFDLSTTPPTSVITAVSSFLPRQKAGQALIGTTLYVVEGSADKSDYVGQTETIDVSSGNFTSYTNYAKATIFRTSFGCAAAAIGANNYVFAMGGLGSGHLPGWLKMEVTTSPEEVNADGKQTATVTVTATDGSGDPPADGTVFRARGLVYVTKTQKATAQAAAGDSIVTTDKTRAPMPTISILPVLFSSQTMLLSSGTASTILLARSEDMVNEVDNLLNFVKGNETAIVDQQALKSQPDAFSNSTQKIGETRTLYSVALEVSVEDAFYYGQTDSDATTSDTADVPLATSSFSFSPPVSRQGRSGSVQFSSDITSVPDVEFVVGTTDAVDVSNMIDDLSQEIPFGASPHYDSIVAGAKHRIITPPPIFPPTNMMVTASDNEESGSSYSAAETAEEVNLVDGPQKFPVFITTVVVTDPLSLAARKARTDVSDLELISSETGGHSFSLDNASYINFIIDRIKTSAPSSMGSGSITMRHEMAGPITGFEFTVDNMIVGNSATLTARYSLDGYNFIDTGISLEASTNDYGYGMPVTTAYSFGVPLNAMIVEYTVTMTSKTFSSPLLESVIIKWIEPNVQYLFTYPQTVGGQVSEMALVTNERLPSGGTVTAGFIHGDSKSFDTEYVTSAQPAVSGRGTVTAIQRTGPLINGEIFRDELTTTDGLIFTSKSGPWAQDSVTRVFVQNQEVLPSLFIAVPDQGLIVFRQRLALTEVPTIEVQNKSTFVVGLKIANPTLQSGVLDSFAYMWGETEAIKGLKPNRPPVATNLFITPSPVFPGGPMVANYTFVDPDGDEENPEQTQITWYRNGVPVVELSNKKSVSNSDILANRADQSASNLISRGQQWFFSVRPSDGQSYGPLSISNSITVANIPPSATGAALTSSNKDDPLTFTSSDTITAQYKFDDNDQGDSDAGTTYEFFVNGISVKSGTANIIAPDEEDSLGNKLLGAGKTVYAIITPFDGRDFGDPVTTSTITILPTPPTVANVSILPTTASPLSYLKLSYQFVSIDGEQDQSTVEWYMNETHMATFDTIGHTPDPVIPTGTLKSGQKWYAIVTPKGSSTTGEAVKSNVVSVD